MGRKSREKRERRRAAALGARRLTALETSILKQLAVEFVRRNGRAPVAGDVLIVDDGDEFFLERDLPAELLPPSVR